MKKEELFETLGDIDEKYIQAAHAEQNKRKSFAWKNLATVAACLALLLVAGIPMVNHLSSNEGENVSDSENVRDVGDKLLNMWENSEATEPTETTGSTEDTDEAVETVYTSDYLGELQAKISAAMDNNELPFVKSCVVSEEANNVVVEVTTDDEAELAKLYALDTIGGAIEIKYEDN